MYQKWTEEQYRSSELDALNAQRDAIQAELENAESVVTTEELRSQKDACVSEYMRRNAAIELRSAKLEAIKNGTADVVARSAETVEDADPTASVEYRTAFMNYILRGEKSEVLLRENQNTKTTDVGTVIPAPVVNTIIEKISARGMIMSRVTRTNYPVGQEYPTSSVKPTASWVNEGAGSYRQKKTTSKISFTHHKLRCEISMSMEVRVMSLSAFEAKFIENVVEAMLAAQEQAIISGSGSGQPTGILHETPESGQAIELAYNTALTYDLIVDAEAAIPQQYESNVVWCMTKKTLMEFYKVKDNDGKNIVTIHQNIGQGPAYYLFGREVVLCGDYMDNYVKQPTADKIFAFLFNFKDYVLNTNYNMGVSSKQDWDTEDWLWKAVLACDGKVIDKNSLVTLKIKKESL